MQRKQHQPFHPGVCQGLIPGRVPFPDQFHLLLIADDQAETAPEGIRPCLGQRIKIVVHIIVHPRKNGSVRPGLGEYGNLPPCLVRQQDAAELGVADFPDIFQHFLRDLLKRLVLPQFDAGADDFNEEDDSYEILTSPEAFEAVEKAFQDAKIPMASAEVTMIPQNYVDVTDPETVKLITRILDLLDEDDDVQNVYTNWNE